MCLVNTGAYVSLLTLGNRLLYRLPPKKTTTYILHVEPLLLRIRTTDAIQLEKRYKEKKDKGKERKDKKAKKRK